MKNKALIIINIVILSCVAMGLLVFMFLGLDHRFDFWNAEKNLLKTEKYNLNDIEKLVSDLKSFDIQLKYGNESQVIVEVYGSEKNKNNILVENKNGTLNIKQTGSSICFGFCYQASEIVIYVPTQFNKNIDFKTASGDIDIMVGLLESGNNVKTTSGDISVESINGGVVASTSGDIKITQSRDISVSTTSGDIYIDDIDNADIKTTSGEVSINNLLRGGNIKSTSGDIRINKFLIGKDTNIESTSGDVDVYLNNDAYINAASNSGDRNIKASRGDYELKIRTTSGDITVR